jgi:hypothetical protein
MADGDPCGTVVTTDIPANKVGGVEQLYKDQGAQTTRIGPDANNNYTVVAAFPPCPTGGNTLTTGAFSG